MVLAALALACTAQAAVGFNGASLQIQSIHGCPMANGPTCSTSPRHLLNMKMNARKVPVEVQVACERVAEELFRGQELEPTWQQVIQANARHRAQHGQLSGEYLLLDGPFESRGSGVRAAAIKGDARAMHTLGLLYFGGYGGLQQSDVCSARWHAAAAAAGNWDAVAVLGGCLRKGAGIERDEALGLKFIALSSEVDNVQGLIKQGVLFEDGGDYKTALSFYLRAARQDSALALFYVGWALLGSDRGWTRSLKGERLPDGFPRNAVAAEDMWRRAAALAPADGSEEAAYHLALRIQDRGRPGREEARKLLQVLVSRKMHHHRTMEWEKEREESLGVPDTREEA